MSQSAFAAALLDPAAPVPRGLTDPQGRPAGRRFDVYRNNVVASLARAVAEGFPALARLIGAEATRALGIAYARAHPPRSPVLADYGAEMPAFLAGFPPLAGRGELPDLARLELALRAAYHAADAPPLAPAAWQALPPDRLAAARLVFAPAVRLVSAAHPVVSLRRHALEGAPPPPARSETALVTRPGWDPQPHALAPGAAACLARAMAGAPLGAALEAGAAAAPEFDPSALIGTLLAGGAVTAIQEPAP